MENSQLISAKSKAETAARLEPGLLSVFQMILAVMAGLQLLAIILFMASGQSSERGSIIATVVALDWLGIVSLLLYLYSKRLLVMLKQWFLPIALVLYTAGAIVQRYVFLYMFVNSVELTQIMTRDRPDFVAQDSAWGTLLSLLVPLVMVAWQYDIKRVAGYVLAIVVFEIPLIWFFHSAQVGPIEEAFLFAAVVRTVIFLAVGYLVTRMIGAQRQQQLELAAANDKLLEHATTLEQLTISRERNRMARELHDTLAHSLSAVSVQLEAVDSAFESSPSDARRLLTKALAQTRSGLAETRRALQSLRASPLDDLGLRLAVQTLAETTAKRGGLKLTLKMEDVDDLPPVMEQDIYRIAQEAMNNVLRHANATQMEVSLVRINGNLILAIGDNGAGFATSKGFANGHFGLQGMTERAELIGAELTVKSSLGQGTLIELNKPLE